MAAWGSREGQPCGSELELCQRKQAWSLTQPLHALGPVTLASGWQG